MTYAQSTIPIIRFLRRLVTTSTHRHKNVQNVQILIWCSETPMGRDPDESQLSRETWPQPRCRWQRCGTLATLVRMLGRRLPIHEHARATVEFAVHRWRKILTRFVPSSTRWARSASGRCSVTILLSMGVSATMPAFVLRPAPSTESAST